jgi:ElaB/YqjD/DUF883 family membrane-anchored ribosome-binding protein
MTNSKHDVEELKSIQSDAAKLRAQRKRRRSTQVSSAEHPSGIEENQNNTEKQAVQDSAGEAQALESETNVQHFADQLASAVKQFEDTAREHPALALLAAFTTGVVVGNLFSRK